MLWGIFFKILIVLIDYVCSINSRSSRPEVFCKKSVLRNLSKFTGKHQRQSLWHRCFPVNFVKFLRTQLFIEHLWWLLLLIPLLFMQGLLNVKANVIWSLGHADKSRPLHTQKTVMLLFWFRVKWHAWTLQKSILFYSLICFSLKLKISSLLSYIWLKSNLKATLLVIETDTKYWVYSCYQSICLVSTVRDIAAYYIQYDMPSWKLLG